MDVKMIRELVAEMEKLNLQKIVYKKGDFEIHLEKQTSSSHSAHVVHHAPPKITKEEPKAEEAPGVFVTSPMVGTYYASPAPDQPHFVKVGDTVHEKTIVCIVEAMKVMNEVKAHVNGKIAEILVRNGQPIEFGTRLFRVV